MMHSRFDAAGAEVRVAGASCAGIGAATGRACHAPRSRVAITGAQDLGAAVLFLSSEGAGFMTGTCRAIDGGYFVA